MGRRRLRAGLKQGPNPIIAIRSICVRHFAAMKPLSILLLLAAPAPALAQKLPSTHDEAQRIVRAEAERWRFPLVDQDEHDTRFPDQLAVIVTRDAPRCLTHYTIRYAPFTLPDGKPHAAVEREVEMDWATSRRHAIVNGSVVTLSWREQNDTYEWNLETGTPERAEAFAGAADFLTDLCTNEADAKPAKKKG